MFLFTISHFGIYEMSSEFETTSGFEDRSDGIRVNGGNDPNVYRDVFLEDREKFRMRLYKKWKKNSKRYRSLLSDSVKYMRSNARLRMRFDEDGESDEATKDDNTSDGVFSGIAKDLKIKVPDKYIKQLECIINTISLMYQCTSVTQLIQVVTLYVQTQLRGSISNTLRDFISNLFMEKQNNRDPGWLVFLRKLEKNWTSYLNAPIFAKFSELLGIMVHVGLCNAGDVTFSLKGFELVKPTLVDGTKTCFDVITSVLKLVNHFAETAYACYVDRSVKPLCMTDDMAQKLDDDFVKLKSWYALAKNGNLGEVNVTESEYSELLAHCDDGFRSLRRTAKSIFKAAIEHKLLEIAFMKNDFHRTLKGKGFKKAAYAFLIYGDSSIGKSTACAEAISVINSVFGEKNEDRFTTRFDESQAHDNTHKTLNHTIIWDDVGKKRPDAKDGNHGQAPGECMFKLVNNVTFYADKAEIEGKGEVMYKHRLLAMTSNIHHFHAKATASCPYAVQRRCHVYIKLEVKDEYKDQYTGGLDTGKAPISSDLISDIWRVTLCRAHKPKNEHDLGPLRVIQHDGKHLQNISWKDALTFLAKDAKEYDERQDKLVKEFYEQDKFTKCVECGIPTQLCKCCKEPKVETISDVEKQYLIESLFAWDMIQPRICGWLTRFVVKLYMHHSVLPYCNFISLIPDMMWNNPGIRWVIYLMYSQYVFLIVLFLTIVNVVGTVWPLYWIWYSLWPYLAKWLVTIIILVIAYFCQLNVIALASGFVTFVLARKRNMAHEYVVFAREHSISKFILMAGSFVILVKFVHMVMDSESLIKKYLLIAKQGNLTPNSSSFDRDDEQDVWKPAEVAPSSVYTCTKTIPYDDFNNIIKRNFRRAEFYEDYVGSVNVLWLKTGFLLVPFHYIKDCKKPYLRMRILNSRNNVIGSKQNVVINLNHVHKIPHKDLCVCHVQSGGQKRDLTNYLVDIVYDKLPASFMTYVDGESTIVTCLAKQAKTSDGHGYSYNLGIDTFNGMCGSILLARTKFPAIVGMHTDGRSDTDFGFSNMIIKEDIMMAISSLNKKPNVLNMSSVNDDMRSTFFKPDITNGDEIHYKHGINYLKEASFEVFGPCIGAVDSSDTVEKLICSDAVEKYCGVKSEVYTAPQFKPRWYGFQKNLDALGKPGEQLPPDLMDRAIEDYLAPILEFVDINDYFTKPLTREECVNGIDGKKFIDAIPKSTSMGFPLSGPKRDHMFTKVDGSYDFNAYVWDEYDAAISNLLNGMTTGGVAKAVKKDEILKRKNADMQKMRIMYANSVVTSLIIRTYFLPIMRLLQMLPIMSECAVGINCHSQEWEQMYENVTKYGIERLVAGDYGSYDQLMPSSSLSSAFVVLIRIAKKVGYSDIDIAVMEAIVGDIVFSRIAYDGVLIALTDGGHISGNPCTAVVNSIVGCLQMRCYFFSIHGVETKKDFRDCVSLMTYGDDNVATVTEDSQMTIKGFSHFMGSYGQTYTMPDKESELVDYLPIDQFEFLKRKNVVCGKTCAKGALLETSIFKSLHYHLRNKNLTDEEAAAANISGALREFFNHGRDVYEHRRLQMGKVANDCGVYYLIADDIELSYDERVDAWKEKYEKNEDTDSSEFD